MCVGRSWRYGHEGSLRVPASRISCVLGFLLIVAVFAALLTLSHRRQLKASTNHLEVTVYGHEVALTPGPPPPSGLRPRPNHVPSVMLDLFNRGPHEQLAAEIVRSLMPRTIDEMQHRQPAGRGREHLHLLTFDLPGLDPVEALHSAQLRLTLAFIDSDLQPARDVESTVQVYWDSTEPSLSLHVRDKALEKRINFNCTDVIHRFQSLQKSQGGELQLIVGVTLPPELKVYPLVAGENVDQQPLLLLLYTPSHTHQNISTAENSVTLFKRDLVAEDYEEETNQVWPGAPPKVKSKKTRSFCRRRSLYIEFSDINYDTWIVAPTGYQMAAKIMGEPIVRPGFSWQYRPYGRLRNYYLS